MVTLLVAGLAFSEQDSAETTAEEIWGIILLSLCVAVPGIFLFYKGDTKKWMLLIFCTFTFAFGIILIFENRLTEIGVGDFFSAKVTQANKDLDEIKNLRDSAIIQSGEIDSLVSEIEKASKRIRTLESKTIRTNARITSVEERVELSNDNLKQKLARVDSLYLKSQKALSQLTLLNDFTSTVVDAQNNSRKAFDKICAWCDDKSYPFVKQAVNVWHKIKNDYGESIFIPLFQFPWKDGIDPSKLSLSDLINLYSNKKFNPINKPALIEYIWNRNDFTKRSKMEFLLLVLKEDDSLLVLQYAGSYFKREAKLHISPILWKRQVKWWSENEHKFKQ